MSLLDHLLLYVEGTALPKTLFNFFRFQMTQGDNTFPYYPPMYFYFSGTDACF